MGLVLVMIEVVKYKAEHALLLLEREVQERNFYLSDLPNWEEIAYAWEKSGPAFTLLIDGKPEACGGIGFLDKTLGECWIFIPRTDRACIIYRNILKNFNRLIVLHKFRRLQAHVFPNFANGVKLVERLGFEKEGRCRQHGPNGEDMDLYSRVF